MAKVSEIKFDINGVDYKLNINCNSSGKFNVSIPKEVSEALRIDNNLSSDTLLELKKEFQEKLDSYKKIKTTETLHILIAYQACGKYSYKADGSVLFGNTNKKHSISSSFSEIENAVGLDFFVAIKEDNDGKIKWFKAKLGKTFAFFQKESLQPEIYHKTNEIYVHRLDRYKIIPFNEKALNTLLLAQEKMRLLSENLFNFINQPEEQIMSTLTNQKLLNT